MQDFSSCGVNATDPNAVLNLTCLPILFSNLLFWLLAIVGLVCVILVIYGGARFVFSGGDEKQVDGARKTITYAIIGLVIVLFAAVIINLIGVISGVSCFEFGPGWSLGVCQQNVPPPPTPSPPTPDPNAGGSGLH